jgi:branched-chain amino acid transport system ATP-binding protein
VSDVTRFECRDIKAGYGDVCIIPSFDLVATSGDVVAILGPNGAGKTTLLNALAGLLPTQAGTVAVNGVQIKKGHPAEASAAGLVLVPDDRALFTTLTVDENLRAARHRHATTTVDDVIGLFPALGLRRKLTVGNLSGGEQQMLAMARALMQEPKVLLIDEMSMGLAPVIVEALLPMVRTIADERHAVVVLVEQHVGLALEVADRAIVLVHGQVSLDEPAAALKGNVELLEAAYFGGHAATNGATP